MQLRRGILGGTTLLFAMHGGACLDDTAGTTGTTGGDATADVGADMTAGDVTADVAVDTVADNGIPDVAVDASVDACQEPSATPEQLVGTPCDNIASQALCDADDPSKTAVYCGFSGTWEIPFPGDFCELCTQVECDWDRADSCGIAVGFVGISRAGASRRALAELRAVV